MSVSWSITEPCCPDAARRLRVLAVHPTLSGGPRSLCRLELNLETRLDASLAAGARHARPVAGSGAAPPPGQRDGARLRRAVRVCGDRDPDLRVHRGFFAADRRAHRY